ncbi:hypothetical protein ACNKHL_18725 [Shigella flexneri]
MSWRTSPHSRETACDVPSFSPETAQCSIQAQIFIACAEKHKGGENQPGDAAELEKPETAHERILQ